MNGDAIHPIVIIIITVVIARQIVVNHVIIVKERYQEVHQIAELETRRQRI